MNNISELKNILFYPNYNDKPNTSLLAEAAHIFSRMPGNNLHHKLTHSIAQNPAIHTSEAKLFLLQYLQKAASWNDNLSNQHGRPISELMPQTTDYHRSYTPTNSTLGLCAKLLSEEARKLNCNLDLNHMLLLQTEAFKESINLYNDTFEPTNFDEIEKILHLLIKDTETNNEGPPLFLLTDSLTRHCNDLNEKITYSNEINDFVYACLEELLANKENDLREKIYKRLGVISFLKFKEMHFIHFPTQNDMTQSDSYIDEKIELIKHQIVTSGHTPTMLTAGRTSSNLLDVPQARHQDVLSPAIEYPSFDGFLSRDAMQQYMLFANHSENNAFALLAKSHMHMIQGLGDFLFIDNMHDKTYGHLIQSSLARMEHLLEQSLGQLSDLQAFSLTHELIMEELLLLLNILQPYTEEDFQHVFRCNLEQNAHLAPLTAVFSSGSGSLDAIIRGQQQCKPDMKIASSNQSYFETNGYLSDLKSRSIFGDAKLPQTHILKADQLLNSIAEMASTSIEPDLVILEKHFNLSLSAAAYHSVDLVSATRQLLHARTAPLSLALDTTLDKLHSKEIERLITTFNEEIASGKLNIILFRSANKFDQLGMDKINGGYLVIYSADQHLRKIFSNLAGKVNGPDYQLLTHLHKYAHRQIHNYNKIHYKNAEVLYQALAPFMNAPHSILKITPKLDKKLFFLDLRYPAIKSDAEAFQTLFYEYMSKQGHLMGVSLVRRASFGYNETTLGGGGPDVIRLSLGTHSSEDVQKIAVILANFEAKIQEHLLSQPSHVLDIQKLRKLLD